MIITIAVIGIGTTVSIMASTIRLIRICVFNDTFIVLWLKGIQDM